MLYTYEDNEQPLIFRIAICLNFNCYFFQLILVYLMILLLLIKLLFMFRFSKFERTYEWDDRRSYAALLYSDVAVECDSRRVIGASHSSWESWAQRIDRSAKRSSNCKYFGQPFGSRTVRFPYRAKLLVTFQLG